MPRMVVRLDHRHNAGKLHITVGNIKTLSPALLNKMNEEINNVI